ncbi:HAD-IIA family hydrolase [Tsukamurella sp. 8J]|uniref:HAD-IIA family hydrolase n=1 Tax=Tsukamurella sp. 8J TaxID=3031962 RepID=UPI0023B9ABFA|nr:HAD-IIA family hydrolase [Tsukamurella sp. 8J]MDF0532640.1 HAD-IIA family hydrolase [Tsukamurella sp. 8J]
MTSRPLVARYDALLVDLDGTVYAGRNAIPGAKEALDGLPAWFVTNNASRPPSDVAEQLRSLGFAATEESVVTSAQAGAALLSTLVPEGARVLVVGAPALRDEVLSRGMVPVDSFDDGPAAVIQGHDPQTGWAQLAEATLAIRAGAVWVACNIDATLPSERGLLAGNGAMVAALECSTGRSPQVAGKPGAPLLHDAARKAGSARPLVVGDRLDTDIEGGHTVGADTFMVLTGVNTVDDLLRAPDRMQPTFVAPTLAGLRGDAEASRPGPRSAWTATVDGDVLHLASGPAAEPGDAMYAAIAAARRVPEADRVRLELADGAPAPWRAAVG